MNPGDVPIPGWEMEWGDSCPFHPDSVPHSVLWHGAPRGKAAWPAVCLLGVSAVCVHQAPRAGAGKTEPVPAPTEAKVSAHARGAVPFSAPAGGWLPWGRACVPKDCPWGATAQKGPESTSVCPAMKRPKLAAWGGCNSAHPPSVIAIVNAVSNLIEGHRRCDTLPSLHTVQAGLAHRQLSPGAGAPGLLVCSGSLVLWSLKENSRWKLCSLGPLMQLPPGEASR